MRRRASRIFPSSTRLDRGGVLVMDGPAQSEYEHCTASVLQGPRVNLTYRCVAQHTASCPLKVCARFGRAKFPLVGRGRKQLVHFMGIGAPFVNPCVCPLGQHLDFHWEGGIVTVVSVHPARRCTSLLGVVPAGSGDGVGDCHDAAILPRVRLFISLVYLFGRTNYTFFKSMVVGFFTTAGYASS